MSVMRILYELSISCHSSLHSSSPLPPLHQAWRHPPTAGGDEPPPGWWQRSEAWEKRGALRFRGGHTLDVQTMENILRLDADLRSQSKRKLWVKKKASHTKSGTSCRQSTNTRLHFVFCGFSVMSWVVRCSDLRLTRVTNASHPPTQISRIHWHHRVQNTSLRRIEARCCRAISDCVPRRFLIGYCSFFFFNPSVTCSDDVNPGWTSPWVNTYCICLCILMCTTTFMCDWLGVKNKTRPPSQCGAPRPAGNSSRSSAPLFSPPPPHPQCFPWWC